MLKPLTSAEVYLSEADELLNQGDTVQASEKYYKAAEEAIKILAQKQGIIASREGLEGLIELVDKLSDAYGENILIYWGSAVSLATADLNDIDTIKEISKYVRKLVELAINSKMDK